MHTSARVMVATFALLLVAAFAIVPGTARANMDKPTWAAGDFWVYSLVSGSAGLTLNASVTWTDSTVVWTSSTNATRTTWSHATLTTTFEVQSDATITVPAGTFTTTPVKETNTANLTYTMNYWSAQVGNWVRVGDYDGSGRNTDNFNLSSYNYQGGSFFTSIVFGLPVWIWLILLVVILVAVIGLFAVRRRRPPTRAMPPSPPQMPPQEPMGPEGPPPP